MPEDQIVPLNDSPRRDAHLLEIANVVGIETEKGNRP